MTTVDLIMLGPCMRTIQGLRLPVLKLVHDFVKHEPSFCSLGCASAQIGHSDQRFPHGPSPSACPRPLIGRQIPAEFLALAAREERPRDSHVARGVAHPQTTKVNDCAEVAISH